MKYFGTDGIRGVAYDFLTYDLAYKVGKSLQVINKKLLVIGRDTRESGVMLRDGIIKGANDAGIYAVDLGIVSTPMLAYISGVLDSIGVMITASHNPYHDNGIKVFSSGKKLFLEEESQIEAVLNDEIKIESKQVLIHDLESFNAFDKYLDLYKNILTKSNFKIGLDLANGATYEIGEKVFNLITSDLKVMANQPNGKNINENVGSTHLESLIEFVKENKLDYGFAFDGDGDRLMVVDNDGIIYDGDMLIYVFAVYMKTQGLLNQNTVVLTKMSNLGIIKALKRQGIDVLLTDVGDKYVLEALTSNNYTIGGENSGHIINLSLLNTGDGVLNAVYLVKILTESKKTLNELTKDIIMYPDKIYNIKNVNKNLVNHQEVINKVNEIKNRLKDEGKVIVRPSGTEPLIRVSVSCKSMNEVDQTIAEIVDLINNLNNAGDIK